MGWQDIINVSMGRSQDQNQDVYDSTMGFGQDSGAAPAPLAGVVVQLGDSIGGGWSDNPRYAAIDMLGFPPEVVVNNTLAMDGRSLGQTWIDAPNLFASMYQAGKACVAVIQRGTNDLGNDSRSAVDTYAIATDLVAQAQRQGFYVIIATVLPRTGTVFNWSSAKGTELLAYNDLVRANAAGADAVMDLYNDPIMGGAATPDNTALYRDKVHPTKAGQDRLVVSYKAAITSLLSLAPRISASSPTPIVLGSRTYGTGKFDKALTSGQGVIALAAVPALAAPFTVEGWVRRSGAPGTFAVIAGQRKQDELAAEPAWFIGVAGGSTVLRFSLGDNGDVTTTGVIADGAWHHVAFVVEAAATRAYVDGQLVGSRASSLTQPAVSATDFAHLATGGTDFPWGGDLDSFAFFNTARYSANFTPPTAPVAAGTAGLIAAYPLDGNAAGLR